MVTDSEYQLPHYVKPAQQNPLDQSPSKTCGQPNLGSNRSSPAAASTNQQPESSAAQGNQQAGSRPDSLLIHGLSVERYRAIYKSVLEPSVLTALASSSKNTDYVCQVLELKQQLWTKLGKPCLHETVREDGRVDVTEIMDLT